MTVNIANETMNDFSGEVRMYVSASDLKIKEEYIRKISVDRLSSKDVFEVKIDLSDAHNDFLYVDLYDENGKFICRNSQLLIPAKHYNFNKPEINVEIKRYISDFYKIIFHLPIWLEQPNKI